VVIRNRKGAEIHSVEDWQTLAPPASSKHWKDGRSAKELATAWTTSSGPAALIELFTGNDDLGALRIRDAIAEAQVAFDDFPGGKRNHDLLIRGECAGGPVVIGLEAKADETFGETIATYRRKAIAVREAGKSTNAPERLENLLSDIALISLDRNPTFGDLRYQLFSGVAGTLAAASKPGEIAVFVVHEFATFETTAAKRAKNKLALSQFVGDVTAAVTPDRDAWLLGPFHVPAQRWIEVPLYVGHLTTAGDWDNRAALASAAG
jgi:hypothetical protein